MADLLVASALTFTVSYLLLRNRPASSDPKPNPPNALKTTEQVTTTSIRTRMGDAIGTGSEIGVTREQMSQTPRTAEADVQLSHSLRPTAPPATLHILEPSLIPAPTGAPAAPSAAPQLLEARSNEERLAEAEMRAARAQILQGNAITTYSATPARLLDLETMQPPRITTITTEPGDSVMAAAEAQRAQSDFSFVPDAGGNRALAPLQL